MRIVFRSAVMALLLAASAAFAQHAPYSVQETEVGTLLDDPAAAAILEKHMPGFTTNDKISAARGFTLASLQTFVPSITDKILADIDKDLKNLPPKNQS